MSAVANPPPNPVPNPVRGEAALRVAGNMMPRASSSI